ncbi:two-component system response regulator [Litorivita pollutaquae]|uniref:Two-component system response regulator n=1 Tax=Litorivita pollutaquae TaxID=2200892 RepID=A0A2V4N2C7_9RHOB|nr:ANTAR domain-containing protein [Litorivita pollutaquae]OUS21070.1 two-component system response regulator [Rhodobacterales bacterium 59_46_T64]PYC48944.1 two-component system response regulator [Litorivita pollutaquae]
MSYDLKIAVVEADAGRSAEILQGLADGGWTDVVVLSETRALARRLSEIDPDLVLIDLANPSRDLLENLSAASGASTRPVAMFVDRSDDGMTGAAIKAGLSAYVVDGLKKDRIKPVLETAIARFRMISQMRSELDAAKLALAERKTIDRAKGLLMQAKGIGEDEAYSLLRRTAMDQNRKLTDVAQALITATELLQ